MPVAPDSNPSFGTYAYPHRLVTTEWLSANIGAPGLKIIETNEDILLYDIGHVPGAIKIDWRTELIDPLTRDVVNAERFAELMRIKGIERDDTVVVYGDKGNGTAAATVWTMHLYGHQDVRLLDGGRDAWISEARDTTFEVPFAGAGDYPKVDRDDRTARAFREDVVDGLGGSLVDVRPLAEYTGEHTLLTDHELERALRGGHIPTAVNIPWMTAVGPDSRFRPRAELDVVYGAVGAAPIVYGRVGERSAHTWFVLTFLLGIEGVRNYDGSWTEWGNAVGMPIVMGAEPGTAPEIAARR
ncbi:sulfurtransferase [Nocardia otitidiscaviarum]|uniref:sulfurtransferase n=1 Tax=Nocardia otitidiscaviarum TaxID=1823 RepID=UPI0018935ED3|nr:sulfurtransferase [Nocardia otitidiscaviarum]MBF6235561.1 sulfurtransferase [Nocardia otitidiscaviarum]